METREGSQSAFNDWETADLWTPIDLEGDLSGDPRVQLCKLNLRTYYSTPHLYPMFKDLVKLSKCYGSNLKTESLSYLVARLVPSSSSGTNKQPSGFVFHESRVGSTLIANMLGSDPRSLVFSESSPPMKALIHSKGSREKRIRLFRDVLMVMSASPIHAHIFFKFQSISNTAIDLALEVILHVSIAALGIFV